MITGRNQRQEVSALTAKIEARDLTSGELESIASLPNGALIIGGTLAVETPFTSGKTDTLEVMGPKNENILQMTDIASKSVHMLSPLARVKGPDDKDIRVIWRGVGTPPVNGTIYLTVLYTVFGRMKQGA